MKIMKLIAKNVKRLTVVEINPAGNLVKITGKNGQGKTSVLDAIWMALDPKGIPSKPIHNGAKTGNIVLTLGDGHKVELVVERKFTETDNYLSVMTASGAKYPKPQHFVDDLIGALTFDPLEFMRAKTADKFAIVRGLVKLTVQPEDVERLNAVDYAARTVFNRDAKALRTRAEAMMLPAIIPEAVDEAGLLTEMQEAAAKNAALFQQKAGRAEMVKITGDAAARARQLRDDAAAAIAAAEVLEKNCTETLARIDAMEVLPEPVDIADLRKRVDDAKTANAIVAKARQRKAIEVDAARAEKKAEELTTAMETRKTELDEALVEASANLPVKGLQIANGGVLFNNVPIDQASDAEQLMVSTEIAAALNPKLRVIRIRNGSLLDDDAMARLAAFAEERDFQIWIELVDGSGEIGIVMEDGHVKGQAVR